MDADALKARIRAAFDAVEYPGDDRIAVTNSYGPEPELTAELFRGKRDRWALTPEFLDEAHRRSDCLYFFTPEALRFYLPAYLLADLCGGLSETEPAFGLWTGLTNDKIDRVASPAWTGEATWGDLERDKFAAFDVEQARCVVEFLRQRVEFNGFDLSNVEQALRNFWLAKAGIES